MGQDGPSFHIYPVAICLPLPLLLLVLQLLHKVAIPPRLPWGKGGAGISLRQDWGAWREGVLLAEQVIEGVHQGLGGVFKTWNLLRGGARRTVVHQQWVHRVHLLNRQNGGPTGMVLLAREDIDAHKDQLWKGRGQGFGKGSCCSLALRALPHTASARLKAARLCWMPSLLCACKQQACRQACRGQIRTCPHRDADCKHHRLQGVVALVLLVIDAARDNAE